MPDRKKILLLTTEAAMIKLGWAISQGMSPAETAALFETGLAGEITPCEERKIHIDLTQQIDKLLFDAPAKASPVQGEVAKIFDFCRRGCQFFDFDVIEAERTIPQSKIRDF